MPTPIRFWPAPVPAVVAWPVGFEEAPICFSDMVGAPGSRATSPPSWSVISSSGCFTTLAACAVRS